MHTSEVHDRVAAPLTSAVAEHMRPQWRSAFVSSRCHCYIPSSNCREPQLHISTSMNKKTFMCGAHVCACVIKSVRVHVRVCVASILHIRCMFACVRMWVAQTRGPLARSSRWHQSAAAAVLVGAIHSRDGQRLGGGWCRYSSSGGG